MIFTVTMGVGEYFPNIRDIHKSYRQAPNLDKPRLPDRKVRLHTLLQRMGIYRLLSSIAGRTKPASS